MQTPNDQGVCQAPAAVDCGVGGGLSALCNVLGGRTDARITLPPMVMGAGDGVGPGAAHCGSRQQQQNYLVVLVICGGWWQFQWLRRVMGANRVCPLVTLVINLESKSLWSWGDVLAYKGLPCAYHGQMTSPSSGQVNTHLLCIVKS